ncbi:MAG: hypothetical protein U5L09_13860 [Bacteroidales bacterium]|nr:hypothetical protein [Bacteroidales bacterium]
MEHDKMIEKLSTHIPGFDHISCAGTAPSRKNHAYFRYGRKRQNTFLPHSS